VPDRLHVPSLLAGSWRELAFQPFREGIEICRLIEGGEESASVALLRYRPGAAVPWHWHQGLETVLVLEGSQSDQRGRHHTGDIVFNAAGTAHSVWSEDGCVVLIQWERPIRIMREETEQEAGLPNDQA
jgi:anti-sigma factor ChrR (cupin superfamily)